METSEEGQNRDESLNNKGLSWVRIPEGCIIYTKESTNTPRDCYNKYDVRLILSEIEESEEINKSKREKISVNLSPSVA